MIENLPHEELLKSFRGEIEEYRGKLVDGSMMFEDKRRIIEKFVKEVRANMNAMKADCASLIETIPFRKEIEPLSSENVKIVTVYVRDKNINNERKLHESDTSANFADVIYHFPFPPKDLGVIVNPCFDRGLFLVRYWG